MISQIKFIDKLFFAVLVAIGFIWLSFSSQFIENEIFWDLDLVIKATALFNKGGNSYSPDQLGGSLSFVYHPLVLHGMAFFGRWLSLLIIFFYIASITYFLFSLKKNSNLWFSTFLAFAYCDIGFISVTSGNLTVFFHLILLANLFAADPQDLSQNKFLNGGKIKPANSSYTYFIIFVLTFSIVKPYLLIYLAIPILMHWGKRESVTKILSFIFIGGSLFLVVVISSSIFYGAEFTAFISALKNQTLGKRDMGFGIVMFFYDYYLSAGSLIYRAFVLHFFIASLLLLVVMYLAIKNKWINTAKKNFASFPYLLYFLLTLFNPRLKVYDFFPALLALYIYFFSLKLTAVSRLLFLLAYILSLTQLTGTLFFVNHGIFSNPINTYYCSIGMILGLILIRLARPNFAS
ncbi:hypothetical protein [Polynucleobacter sp. IMCC 29146]|uniref:hypothetical protein n=1 Tax=Polynucleobacter sp. IMCC 29146 TaxID=2780953 RepID=UPI001F413B02|nr:hypothetical protein [Polynucleobacter sp. IMCC 29146]MCE7530525.1 hypothetical protein [Polynucleobacter sp. IMCC 29146]